MRNDFVAVSLAFVAVPSILWPAPASALSISTVGINLYSGNGGGAPNLVNSDADANNAGSKASSYGWNWAFANNDSNAWGGIYANSGYGGVNTQDMHYYSGHGNDLGPFLGDGASYSDCPNGGPCLTTVPPNYNWSLDRLKWIAANACEWLYDGITTNSPPNWSALSPWYHVFNPSDGNPNGSLHAVLAARSETWDVTGMGSGYMDATLGWQGESAGQGWFDTMWWQMYFYPHSPGVEPAVLDAYQSSTGADWFNESLKSPWPDPDCCGSVEYNYHWDWIGTPSF